MIDSEYTQCRSASLDCPLATPASDEPEPANPLVRLAHISSMNIARPQGGLAPNGLLGLAAAKAQGSMRGETIIHVVDDDCQIRDVIRYMLEAEGLKVEDYGNSEDFLGTYAFGGEGCLLLDARLPGMSGLELLQRLRRDGNRIPVVMITGNADVTMAVEAMKAGASDFLEKPVTRRRLMDCVQVAVKVSRSASRLDTKHRSAVDHLSSLTARQKEILGFVMAGHPNKNIAADIGISQRTVENHRAAIMRKMGAKSLPELTRLVSSLNTENT